MIITATELKNNLGRYLNETRDVIITKNGKTYKKLINIKNNDVEETKRVLKTIGNPGYTLDDIREMRLSNK